MKISLLVFGILVALLSFVNAAPLDFYASNKNLDSSLEHPDLGDFEEADEESGVAADTKGISSIPDDFDFYSNDAVESSLEEPSEDPVMESFPEELYEDSLIEEEPTEIEVDSLVEEAPQNNKEEQKVEYELVDPEKPGYERLFPNQKYLRKVEDGVSLLEKHTRQFVDEQSGTSDQLKQRFKGTLDASVNKWKYDEAKTPLEQWLSEKKLWPEFTIFVKRMVNSFVRVESKKGWLSDLTKEFSKRLISSSEARNL